MRGKRNKKTKHVGTELTSVRNVRIGTENITEDDIRVLTKVAEGIYSKTDFASLAHIVNRQILPKLRSSKELSSHNQGTMAIELIKRYGLDTLFQLHNSIRDGDMAVQMARDLIKDYDCQTPSEKAMAQLGANAFLRILENSRIMIKCGELERVDQLQINFFSMISKELDRAVRQFDTAIGNLIRMKSPSLKVNVTAKTAFVANNQQVNATRNEHYENVETK